MWGSRFFTARFWSARFWNATTADVPISAILTGSGDASANPFVETSMAAVLSGLGSLAASVEIASTSREAILIMTDRASAECSTSDIPSAYLQACDVAAAAFAHSDRLVGV